MVLDRRIGTGKDAEIAVADDHAARRRPRQQALRQGLFADRSGPVHRHPDRPQGDAGAHVVQPHQPDNSPVPRPMLIMSRRERFPQLRLRARLQAGSVQQQYRPLQTRLRLDAPRQILQHLVAHPADLLRADPRTGPRIAVGGTRDSPLPDSLAVRQQRVQTPLRQLPHHFPKRPLWT